MGGATQADEGRVDEAQRHGGEGGGHGDEVGELRGAAARHEAWQATGVAGGGLWVKVDFAKSFWVNVNLDKSIWGKVL